MNPVCDRDKIILENEYMRLTVNAKAQAESLLCKRTHAECLQPGVALPLFSATQQRLYNNELKLSHPNKRSVFPADRVRLEEGKLIVGFSLVPYEAVIAVKIAARYIAFTLEDFLVKPDGYKGLTMNTPPVESVRLQLPVKDRGSFGKWLNVSFDDTAVNLLATSPHAIIDAEDRGGYHIMTADALRDIKLKGCGAALIVSETPALMDAIEAVEEDYDLPRGVKSRRGDRINASVYWTGNANLDNIDEHIAYAKKGGFRMMLLHYGCFVKEQNCWSLCGDYDLKDNFPNGLADVAAVVEKVKAAGITPGLHFLHTHIGLLSRYATPAADHRLHLTRRFTLAKPLSPEDTTVFVDQCPEGVAMAEGCRILRFGGEMITYEGYSPDRPYCFTGCKRGHNGTRIRSLEPGTAGGVLDVSEFCATSVYLDQETDLQDEIADKIAALYNTGFEFIYLDGSEGTNAPFEFHIPNAQYRVWKKLHTPPLFAEGAAKSHFSWHMLSGGNAFDIFPTPVFKEKIIQHPFEQAPRMAQDFTRVNFGWWQYYLDTQPDVYEFGTSRAAAWDCPITMKGWLDRFADNPRTDDILEVMRRWEDVRAKGWLTDAHKQALRDPNTEHILLVGETGDYELVPYRKVAAAGGDDQVSAFVFERKGCSWCVCWHTTGEGKLFLPLKAEQFTYSDEIGSEVITPEIAEDGVLLPLSRRRYIQTTGTMEALIHALEHAKVTDSKTEWRNTNEETRHDPAVDFGGADNGGSIFC